jgi:hypothetical protein
MFGFTIFVGAKLVTSYDPFAGDWTQSSRERRRKGDIINAAPQ